MNKFNYYTYFDNAKDCMAVKAVTTFAGRTVTGVAYDHPTDTFDEEFGKNLARMRCEKKIYKKKVQFSKQRIKEDSVLLVALLDFVEDVKKDIEKSEYILAETEASLKAVTVAINDIAQLPE